MSKYRRMYLGESGENFVVSQFLLRGYNVAVPLIDQGHDLLVLEEGTGKYWPVQVKTATAHKLTMYEYGVGFNLSLKQLIKPTSPDLIYVLTTRYEGLWQPTLIIPREVLHDAYETGGFIRHNLAGDRLRFSVHCQDGEVFCNQANFTKYVENWSEWPEAKGLIPSALG